MLSVRPSALLAICRRPEYVITWLGLLKVGAIVALINTNLKVWRRVATC